MLFILFSAGDDLYGIAAGEVEEVVPFAQLKALPQTHPALAGLLNFHGQPVPVLDLSQLLGGRPAETFLTTRILLCRGALASAPERLLGLLAENAVATRDLDESAFRPPGAAPPDAPHAGSVYEMPDGRYLQRIHPARILPAAVTRELLAQIQEAA